MLRRTAIPRGTHHVGRNAEPILVLAVLDLIDFLRSLLAFALIRAAWAGESFPACSSLVANSSALIWWARSSIGYLRCFGSPNTEPGSLFRVAALSFAIASHALLDVDLNVRMSNFE